MRHASILLKHNLHALACRPRRHAAVLVGHQLRSRADVHWRSALPAVRRQWGHQWVREQRIRSVQVLPRGVRWPDRAGRGLAEVPTARRGGEVVPRGMGLAGGRRERDVRPRAAEGDAGGEGQGARLAGPEDGAGVPLQLEERLEEDEREVAPRAVAAEDDVRGGDGRVERAGRRVEEVQVADQRVEQRCREGVLRSKSVPHAEAAALGELGQLLRRGPVAGWIHEGVPAAVEEEHRGRRGHLRHHRLVLLLLWDIWRWCVARRTRPVRGPLRLDGHQLWLWIASGCVAGFFQALDGLEHCLPDVILLLLLLLLLLVAGHRRQRDFANPDLPLDARVPQRQALHLGDALGGADEERPDHTNNECGTQVDQLRALGEAQGVPECRPNYEGNSRDEYSEEAERKFHSCCLGDPSVEKGACTRCVVSELDWF